MSQHDVAVAMRQEQVRRCGNAMTALVAAGNELLAARADGMAGDEQELITALRDDISDLIANVEALRAVIQRR
jgi:hypothetical protein